ncbi:kinase-like domain-containing protein [Ganoderma leucocontextum]|nr:kinase-like domain-containing protein [Ganoderma leucocontextum]
MHSRAESSPLSNATLPLLSSQLPPPNTGPSSSLASRPSSPSDSPNQSIRSQEVSVSAVPVPLAGRAASSHKAPTETHPTPRSWSEKKEKNVPVEQSEGYVRTRDRVAEVAVNILGTAGEVIHELLKMGEDLVGFVPIGGLQEAIHLVQVNKTVCLRLAERCDTVISWIQEDISTAGGDVEVQLEHPFWRLATVFDEVREFIIKNSSSSFFKQYLRRDEIQRALVNCNSSLADALAMFSTSIQMCILQKIHAAECQRRADTTALLDSINCNAQGSQPSPPPPTHDPLDVVYDNLQLVSAYLQTAIARENDSDAVHAADDLRQLMCLALQVNSDTEMIRILQVSPDEIPEVIKTLQRSLEWEVERDRAEQEAVPFSPLNVGAADVSQMEMAVPNVLTRCETTNSTNSYMSNSFASSAGGSRTPRDTLVREFFENGINVLRRASNQLVPLPSWTITRYEVEPGEKTGEGSVHMGTWDSHVVAIKELTSTAPKELFEHQVSSILLGNVSTVCTQSSCWARLGCKHGDSVHELELAAHLAICVSWAEADVLQVSIWLSLQHSNVCEFIGASWVSRRPPWLITRYYKHGSLVTYLKWLPSLDLVDLLKMIQEIAKGMVYLHGKGVLHGNLKVMNVLVNDDNHCVISNFGQWGMKSETYLSHTDLRWQAPELMSPANSEPAASLSKPTLMQETDVYAFAITVVQLLAKGALPWPLADDRAI